MASTTGASAWERESVTRGPGLGAAFALAAVYVGISVGGTLALDLAVPSLRDRNRDLVVEALLAVYVALVVVLASWRAEVGLTRLSRWRRPMLAVVPLAFTLVPLAGGLRTAQDSLAVLLVGYALNSVAEDGMVAGILPNVLRGRGLPSVILIAPLLFAIAHFGNLASRPDQSLAIAAAQALGVFTQGIGFVLIRITVNSIVPVMVVHFLADLFLQLGGGPIVAASMVESTLFLLYGVWLYRRYKPELVTLGWPSRRVG